MIIKNCNTYEVKIYIAGPIDVAKQVIRKECSREGLCVTVIPTDFLYTQGEEKGYVVGFINYPRFPKEEEEIYNRAIDLGIKLLHETYQGSFTIVASDKSEFYSIREGDKQ